MLHAEVERLSDENLSLAHSLLLEIELHQLTGELDAAANRAQLDHKLTPQSISAAVAAHRLKVPYK
jgi:hypothetical protein